MSKVYNFEDIKNIKFNIQSIFKVFEKSISETIIAQKENCMDFFIKRIANNLLTLNSNKNELVYNTKITFLLKPYEIFIYTVLTYYDITNFTIHDFITQFEKEILNYSVVIAEQRLEFLQLNKKI